MSTIVQYLLQRGNIVEWFPLLPTVTSIVVAFLAYFLGSLRERTVAIRNKQIDAMSELHSHGIDIEQFELTDEAGMSLNIVINKQSTKRNPSMNDDEKAQLGQYQKDLQNWRLNLYREENKARLWLNSRTVNIVGNYLILMMRCKHWERYGQGSLLEDQDFLFRLRSVFGNSERALEKVTIKNSQTKEPALLDVIQLSYLCQDVIRQRMRLEVLHPFLFRLKLLWERLCFR